MGSRESFGLRLICKVVLFLAQSSATQTGGESPETHSVGTHMIYELLRSGHDSGLLVALWCSQFF